MKRNFKYYALVWFILFAVFNAVAFAAPAMPAVKWFTASFWIGWPLTVIAFLVQLYCAWIALKEESAKKTFYNISLFSVSYIGLIFMFVIAIICMIVAPFWVVAIACVPVLIFNILAVIKAKMAIDIVVSVDEKVQNETAFVSAMRIESETLLGIAKSEEEKVICKKVRDAFKFSDPMSKGELKEVENDIKVQFDVLKNAIKTESEVDKNEVAEKLLALIVERNNKCKLLK